MKGILIAFLSVALFSSYPIFGKILLEDVSPFVIILLSQSLAAAMLIIALSLFKKIKKLIKTSNRDIKIIYLLTVLAGVCAPLLFLFGLNFTTASNSILIVKSEVLFTTLIAIIFLKEKVTRFQLVGVLIIVIGIIVIATNSFSSGLMFNIGDILILTAALLWAISTVVFKKYMQHMDPEVVITVRNMFGSTILLILALFFVDFGELAGVLTTEFVLAILGLTVLTVIGGQYFWYKALEMTTVTNVSFAALATPVLTIFYAYIFLQERLTGSQFIGGGLVLLGLVVLEFHFKRHPKKRQARRLKVRNWPHM